MPLPQPTPPMGGATYSLLPSGGFFRSDVFSEPATVSCGFLLSLLARGSCNHVGRTMKHLLRRFSPSQVGQGGGGCCLSPGAALMVLWQINLRDVGGTVTTSYRWLRIYRQKLVPFQRDQCPENL